MGAGQSLKRRAKHVPNEMTYDQCLKIITSEPKNIAERYRQKTVVNRILDNAIAMNDAVKAVEDRIMRENGWTRDELVREWPRLVKEAQEKHEARNKKR